MRTITGEDGKDYYVMIVDRRFYEDFSQIHWRSALDRAKRQLSKLRYWS